MALSYYSSLATHGRVYKASQKARVGQRFCYTECDLLRTQRSFLVSCRRMLSAQPHIGLDSTMSVKRLIFVVGVRVSIT